MQYYVTNNKPNLNPFTTLAAKLAGGVAGGRNFLRLLLNIFLCAPVNDFHIKNTYITFESLAAYAVLIIAKIKRSEHSHVLRFRRI